ncbi:MAG: diketogulonate reductase-like aldo/keto reductase [Myxococcota bacterium]|jgi:diketogulonate reductase-like aldo/keto reductase
MSTDLAASQTLSVQGVTVPAFLYGTAWKEERTEGLVASALAAGFRAIDTANQRKHYFEAGVGAAVQSWLAAGGQRADLILQSKFTHQDGQDHRLPYDPDATPADRVAQSFASSLEHLGTDYLDVLLLHGPEQREGVTAADAAFFAVASDLHDAGKIRLLGVSNVTAAQLTEMIAISRVKLAMVQNRCYARHGWDGDVRAICREHGIVYQGFSLLTANRKTWNHRSVAAIARRLSVTPAQVLFRFALSQGILPITGTTDPRHMAADLTARALVLTGAEVAAIAAIES